MIDIRESGWDPLSRRSGQCFFTEWMGKMQTGPTIILAEDEPKIAGILVDYLAASNFKTIWLEDGTDVVDSVRKHNPALVLLDLMLPGRDGIEICQELRTFTNVPVVMVTARVEEIDRLLGLESGADDYICKPFSPREVVARVKAVLRRFQPNAPDPSQLFAMNDESRTVSVNNQALSLTPNEFNLLKTFVTNPGRVFSRDSLLDHIYDSFKEVTDRTIDSHVKNLRKKIARVLPDRDIIISVYGVGYKLEL